MASNGLMRKAKKGTCRICQRSRNTDNQVRAVGEVCHGFATGHIWECIDLEDCDKVANEKLKASINVVTKSRIEQALNVGRFQQYMCYR